MLAVVHTVYVVHFLYLEYNAVRIINIELNTVRMIIKRTGVYKVQYVNISSHLEYTRALLLRDPPPRADSNH